MQPRSYDDVYLAYAMAVRNQGKTQDHLTEAAREVVRLQVELKGKIEIVRGLREELKAFSTSEVAA